MPASARMHISYSCKVEPSPRREDRGREQAIERFKHAIEIAPEFAIAYVDLANAHVNLASLVSLYPSADPFRTRFVKARPLVAKALQLDDTIGEAYVLRGFIKAYDGDVKGAEADYRKGLDLAPNYGLGHEQFSEFLETDLQRFDDALQAIDRARLVDPLRPRNHYVKGRMLAGIGSFEEAEGLYLRALEIAPDFYPALLRLGEIRWQQGQFAEAVKMGERAFAIEPPAQWVRATLADFYVDLGDIEAARAVLADQLRDSMASVCMFQGRSNGRPRSSLPTRRLMSIRHPEDELVAFAIRMPDWRAVVPRKRAMRSSSGALELEAHRRAQRCGQRRWRWLRSKGSSGTGAKPKHSRAVSFRSMIPMRLLALIRKACCTCAEGDPTRPSAHCSRTWSAAS